MTLIAAGPCGFYGKVPSHADFVVRRLDRDLLTAWDGWLQQLMTTCSRMFGSDWRDMFFTAPIWRFLLGQGLCGQSAVLGIVMPSVDSAGRCFPLTLARALPVDDAIETIVASARWFAEAETRALRSLDDGFALPCFDRDMPDIRLPPRRSLGARPARPERTPRALSIARARILPTSSIGTVSRAASAFISETALRSSEMALWWTTGTRNSPELDRPGSDPAIAVTSGLVDPSLCPALFDSKWAAHGWDVSSTEPDAVFDFS